MPDTPNPSARPFAPSGPDYSADATGLKSINVDLDQVDDLDALAASLGTRQSTPLAAAKTKPIRRSSLSLRATLFPPLLTGGLICESLAMAWFTTDVDSPYRRVSHVLPIVLIVAGGVLLLSAAVNLMLSRRA